MTVMLPRCLSPLSPEVLGAACCPPGWCQGCGVLHVLHVLQILSPMVCLCAMARVPYSRAQLRGGKLAPAGGLWPGPGRYLVTDRQHF